MGEPARDHRAAHTTAELFRWLDVDGDGFIDAIELQAALRALGHDASAEDVRQLIAALDRSGTGKLDEPTFARFARGELPTLEGRVDDPDAELRATFRVMDRDGDGYLSAADVAGAQDVDVAEARAMVQAADTDGDGRLSFREFRRAVTDPGLD